MNLNIVDVSLTLAAGLTYLQPPAGETWLIRSIAFAGTVGNIYQGGAVVTNYFLGSVAPDRTFLILDNTTYLQLSTGSSGYFRAHGFKIDATWPLTAWKQPVQLAALATANYQPPAGENWILRATAQQDPYIVPGYTDGALAAPLGGGYSTRTMRDGWDWRMVFTNAVYCRCANNDDVGSRDCYLCGVKFAANSALWKNAISSIAAAASLNIQPAAGELWMILQAPFNNDSLPIEYYDGAAWQRAARNDGPSVSIPATNANYVRIRNGYGSAQTVAYSAVAMKT